MSEPTARINRRRNNGLMFVLAVVIGIGFPLQVGSAADTPSYTLFGSTQPVAAASLDVRAVELGMRFHADVDGQVTAIRFYRAAANGGTQTGSIWSESGRRLATVTFTNETGSGWQEAALSTPVAIRAGQTYVVSYLAPNGRYAVDPRYFTSSRRSGPLVAPMSVRGARNGVYRYGESGGFPNRSSQAANYYVDVRFVPASGASGTTTTAPSTTAPPTTPSTTAPPTNVTEGVVVGSGASAMTFPERPGLTVPLSSLTPYAGPYQFDSGTYVFENCLVSGTRRIWLPESSTADVTFRNCRFTVSDNNMLLGQGGRVTVEHSVFDGAAATDYNFGLTIEGGGSVRYSEFLNNTDNLRVASDTLVEWNWMHDGKRSTTGGTAHGDGMEIYYGVRPAGRTGPHIIVRNNHISIAGTEGANSAVNITNDFGPIDGVRVEGNTFTAGGGYSLYIRGDGYCGCGGVNRNIEVVNNRWFATSEDLWGGYYGTHSYNPETGVTQWSGNVLRRANGTTVGITLDEAQP